MDRDVQGNLARYWEEQAARPLGNTDSVSGLTLQPFSIAGQQAAGNLLTKAQRALDAGDPDRARGFADRAARLPFDRHEGAAPAAIEGHMELYRLVADALDGSGEDDPRWLEAAIDVLGTAEESHRSEVRDVLATLAQDHELTRWEQNRVRSAIGAIPAGPDPWDLDLDPAELADWLLSTLALCQRYRAALAARG